MSTLGDDDEANSRWIVVSKPDDGFAEALRGLEQTNDWKMRACAARTVAEFALDFAVDQGRMVDRHGMARAVTASEKQAWRFGFDWVPGAVPRPLSDFEPPCEETCAYPGCVVVGCIRRWT